MAATLVVSGCSLVDKLRGGGESSPTLVPSAAPPTGTQGLERFYAQEVTWAACGGGAQCAELEVPLDYADPTGETLRLSLLKMPARSSGSRLGSLVVNPGGPGGSGVDYARAADSIVGASVRRAYDIVGFDPRGVGRSSPVDCFDDAGMDIFNGWEPTPDDEAEIEAWDEQSAAFAQACGETSGALIGHVSTVEAAKDMDILRARLGDAQLNYLGKSYGTFLGATYAGLFPDKVGRFVLDGVVAPDLSSAQINIGQAEGFERATRAWAQYCVDEGSCPLGNSVDEVMTGVADFLLEADSSPLPVRGNGDVTELSEGWAAKGVAVAMYDQGLWSALVDALRTAQDGDGTDLMDLANYYADRDASGGYTGNLLEALYAVNCLDLPEPKSLAEHQAVADEAAKVAPTWGRFLAWGSLPCAHWPVQPPYVPREPITAEGSGPIVVIGTTRDPATPYEWAVQLRRQLSNAALITFDGDGHTAYTRSNSCVDDAVDEYYLKGTVPEDGLTC